MADRKGVLFHPDTGEVMVTKHFNLPIVIKEWA